MGDNLTATGGKRQFQYKVIVRIGEERPPKKMDFLQVGLAGEIAHKPPSSF